MKTTRIYKTSVAVLATLLLGVGVAVAASNGVPHAPGDVVVNTLVPNQGHFLCTAAINSDGTIATATPQFSHVNPALTSRLATGQYQVGFLAPCADARIRQGFFRVVQPDTLFDGSLPAGASGTVADRGGVPAAIFVQCSVGTVVTDMSFTLSLSR